MSETLSSGEVHPLDCEPSVPLANECVSYVPPTSYVPRSNREVAHVPRRFVEAPREPRAPPMPVRRTSEPRYEPMVPRPEHTRNEPIPNRYVDYNPNKRPRSDDTSMKRKLEFVFTSLCAVRSLVRDTTYAGTLRDACNVLEDVMSSL